MAGLITRHDTPPSQTPSPISRHSSIEITGSHIGDAPVLPDLLSQIPAGEEIGSVTADGAHDTRKCHDAIADRGAHAVIPPRKNAKP